MRFSSPRGRVKHQEVEVHLFVHLHYACFVSASVAVVRRREYCHDLLLVTPVVPVHHQLVRPRDQFQTVGVVEVLRNVLAESKASASWRDAPAVTVVRVRPQQVAHGSLVGHFHLSVDLLDLFQGVQVWRESSVQTEDLVLDDCSQRQQVEEVGVVLPDVGVAVLAQAFVVESVDLGNLSGLVVASQDGDSILEPNLDGHKEGDSLDGVVTSVDIVTHEQVVGVWRLSSDLE